MKTLMRTSLSSLAMVALLSCADGPGAPPSSTARERADGATEDGALTDGAAADATVAVPLKVRQPQPPPDLREEVVALRAQRRMYDGAPPRIPHPVNAYQEDCLACHGQAANLGRLTVPTMSHPEMTMCRQCHLELVSATLGQMTPGFADVPNGFVGLESAGKGLPAAVGAPPRVPHPTWFRHNCAACHGRYAREGLRSPHPDRRACEQCHLPFAALNQLVEMPAGFE